MKLAGTALVVDDLPDNLSLISDILSARGHRVRLAVSGKAAIASAELSLPDVVLLDINMPDMDGFEVCARFKASERLKDVPIIFLTAQNETEDVVKAFSIGAADFVPKPFRKEELIARVETHLRIRLLQEELIRKNRDLTAKVDQKLVEIQDSQMATIKVLASQAEFRDNETGRHIRRVQEFCKILAQRLAVSPDYRRIVDPEFVQAIYYSSVLHDIGKVGIPDVILLKPAALTPDEAAVMRTHTLIGARNMEEARRSYPNNTFINMGIDIALCHHERFDGGGYPNGMSGADIPLSARIMNLADQYDALRSERPYKKGIDHSKVYSILVEGDGRTMPSHFDPVILEAFKDTHQEMELVFASLAD
jgi:putative two-component system response regulator